MSTLFDGLVQGCSISSALRWPIDFSSLKGQPADGPKHDCYSATVHSKIYAHGSRLLSIAVV